MNTNKEYKHPRYKYNEYTVSDGNIKFNTSFINNVLRDNLCYINDISGVCKGVDDSNNLIIVNTQVNGTDNKLLSKTVSISVTDVDKNKPLRYMDLKTLKTVNFNYNDIIESNIVFNTDVFKGGKVIHLCIGKNNTAGNLLVANLKSVKEDSIIFTINSDQVTELFDFIVEDIKLSDIRVLDNDKATITLRPNQISKDTVIRVFTEQYLNEIRASKTSDKVNTSGTTDNTTTDTNNSTSKVVDTSNSVGTIIDNRPESTPLIISENTIKFRDYKFKTGSIYSITTKECNVTGILSTITDKEMLLYAYMGSGVTPVIVRILPEDVVNTENSCLLVNPTDMNFIELKYDEIIESSITRTFNSKIKTGDYIFVNSLDTSICFPLTVKSIKDDELIIQPPTATTTAGDVLCILEKLFENNKSFVDQFLDEIMITINIRNLTTDNIFVYEVDKKEQIAGGNDTINLMYEKLYRPQLTELDYAILHLLMGDTIRRVDWEPNKYMYLDRKTGFVFDDSGNKKYNLLNLIQGKWELYVRWADDTTK